MYVYFDRNGDIKAITPSPDNSIPSDCQMTTAPLSEVEEFLTGKFDPFDFLVERYERAGREKFKIVSKKRQITIARSLDNYLTPIGYNSHIIPIIKVRINVNKHIVVLDFDPLFTFDDNNEDAEENNIIQRFINHKSSSLYITQKNNPYHLLHTVTFSPSELFNNKTVSNEYPDYVDLSFASVYTKKIINSYDYKIEGKKHGI